MVRALGLWLTLLLAVAGSSYAQDFSWAANAVVASQPQVAQPLITRHGLCIVTVTIAGKPYEFLLDTGAPTVLSQKIAERLKTPELATINVLDALGNPNRAQVVTVPAIDLSGITVIGIPALVYDDANPIFEALHVQGILGANALRQLAVSVSAQSKTVRFATASVLPETSLFIDASQDAQGSPFIQLAVGNQLQPFLFDSGFEGLADLSDEAAQALPGVNTVAVRTLHWENGYSGINGSETGTARHLQLPAIHFPDATLTNVAATVTGDSRSKIGAALFRLGDVTIDFAARRFSFVPYKAK